MHTGRYELQGHDAVHDQGLECLTFGVFNWYVWFTAQGFTPRPSRNYTSSFTSIQATFATTSLVVSSSPW